MLELLHFNPFRPVDALWKRAVGIVERDEPWASYNRDRGGCGFIKKAQRFWTALLRAETHQQKIALTTKYPEMCWALRLYEQPNDEKLRWAVEARILARQTNDAIAQSCGCPPAMIEYYEALFFNVRTRLGFRDFIMTQVVQIALVGDSQCPSVGSLWKLFGYLGGPHVLDFAMLGFPDVGGGDGARDVSACLKDLAMNVLALKAAVAALSVPVEKRTRFPLMRSFLMQLKRARRGAFNGDSARQLEEGLELVVQDLRAAFNQAGSGYQFPGVEVRPNSPTPPVTDATPGADPSGPIA